MIAARVLAASRAVYESASVDDWAQILTHHVRMHTGIVAASGRDQCYGRDDVMQYLLQERLEFGDCVVTSSKSLQSTATQSSAAPSTQADQGIAVVIRIDVRTAQAATAKCAPQALSVAMLGLVFDERLFRLWRFVARTPGPGVAGIDLPGAARLLASKMPSLAGMPSVYGEVRPALGQVAAAIDNYAIPGADGHTNQLLHRWLDAWNTRRFKAIASRTTASQHPWLHLLARLPDAVFFIERVVQDTSDRAQLAFLWRAIGQVQVAVPHGVRYERVHVQGLTIARIEADQLTAEDVVYDELGMALQLARSAK